LIPGGCRKCRFVDFRLFQIWKEIGTIITPRISGISLRSNMYRLMECSNNSARCPLSRISAWSRGVYSMNYLFSSEGSIYCHIIRSIWPSPTIYLLVMRSCEQYHQCCVPFSSLSQSNLTASKTNQIMFQRQRCNIDRPPNRNLPSGYRHSKLHCLPNVLTVPNKITRSRGCVSVCKGM